MRSDSDETLDLDLDERTSPTPVPRTTYALRVVSGPDLGRVLELDSTSPPHAVVGQASSCAIQLSDRHVSRRHIALTATDTHLLIVDLGSTNGTRVNGALVREARLYGGEMVAIGRTVFAVEADDGHDETSRDAPPPPSSNVAPSSDYLASVIAEEGISFPAARQRVVAEFERRYVEALLERHNGNVTHAARASGVAHRYFQLVRARRTR